MFAITGGTPRSEVRMHKQRVLQILRPEINTCHNVPFNEHLLFSVGFSPWHVRPQEKVYSTPVCVRAPAFPAAYKFFFLLGSKGPIKLSRVFIMGAQCMYMLLYHTGTNFILPPQPSFHLPSQSLPVFCLQLHPRVSILPDSKLPCT